MHTSSRTFDTSTVPFAPMTPETAGSTSTPFLYEKSSAYAPPFSPPSHTPLSLSLSTSIPRLLRTSSSSSYPSPSFTSMLILTSSLGSSPRSRPNRASGSSGSRGMSRWRISCGPAWDHWRSGRGRMSARRIWRASYWRSSEEVMGASQRGISAGSEPLCADIVF
jgi:hypothetical protein